MKARAVFLLLLPGLVAGCTALESDDARARKALARLSDAGLVEELPGGGRIEVPPGSIESMAVTAVPRERGTLQASARVSVDGRLDGTPFSYVGDERFSVRCERTCAVDGPPAPAMLEVLAALRARRAALQAGDPQALGSLATAEGREAIAAGDIKAAAARPAAAWFIRVDRGVAVVGEAAPGGGQKRLILKRTDEGWRFSAGVP